MPNDLKTVQKIIGVKFKDIHFLETALTHKSFAAERGLAEYNERMEFLGDSILSSVSADYLYHKFPNLHEGRLSQLKSQIVSSQNLSKWAKELKLGNFINLSKSEEINGGRQRDNLLCDTMEAVIAAIYLDLGFEPAKRFILNYLSSQKRVIINDSKSKLQERIQSSFKTLPEYRVISETGPDHQKSFEIGVYLRKKLLGAGSGASKKEAEQAAAKKALKLLKSKVGK